MTPAVALDGLCNRPPEIRHRVLIPGPGRETEARRHHAHDPHRRAVQADRPVENAAVGTEPLAPQTIADDHDLTMSWRVLEIRERASEGWCHAHRLKEGRGGPHAQE